MITFYSRPNCTLCKEGMSLLKLVQQEKGFQIQEINIEEDDDLHERYMMHIPVVTQNGKMIQSGLLDYFTLFEEIQIEKTL